MLRCALVGNGGMGSHHLDEYYRFNKENNLIKLVAVCDLRQERLDIVKQEYGPINLYTSVDEMLEKEKPDLVSVVTPTYAHHDVSIKCLNAGANVLCEKPMSLTVKECQEMIDAADKNGKLLMIGQCLRFSTTFNLLKKFVDEKTYGDVISVSYIRSSTGGLEQPTHTWYHEAKLAGGVLYDLHIHDCDIMRYCFGEPDAVTAVGRKVYSTSINDAFAAVYSYRNFVATCQSDWSWKGTGLFRAEYTVNFEKATIFLRDNKIWIGTQGKMEELIPEPCDDLQYNETKYFAECIVNHTPNTINPPVESLKTIALLNASEKSIAAGGRTVELN